MDFADINALYEKPFIELVLEAAAVHRKHFGSIPIDLCKITSIKTGGCPENCGYCSQSAHHKTHVENEKILDVELVLAQARLAKKRGANRFCMGAAWRSPPKKDFPKVIAMIKAIKALGLETCVTLGMLNEAQAKELKENGLDYYNHNLDTSPEYYKKIITTRNYQDRLDTLQHVRNSGLKVCCGGIIGMGESRADRINLLLQLAALPQPPESIPINHLVAIEGTPLAAAQPLDKFEFIRTIAVARILFPTSYLRLSGGRREMSEEMQALCFMAGANSIFFGELLLTTPNPETDADMQLIQKLGLRTKNNEHCEISA